MGPFVTSRSCESVTAQPYPCPNPPSTSAWNALADRVAVWSLASTLEALASQEDALGRGVRGFLHAWREGHRSRLQWVGGRGYVESCPAYVATVEGVTRWAASRGWAALQEAVGWVESSVAQVLSLGVRLRTLPRGVRRGGRHLLLDPWMVSALDSASGWTLEAARRPVRVPRTSRVAQVLSSTRVRTVAVSCPHHRDRDPSLVLWSNGGAVCLSCGWRAAWAEDGDHLLLHSSGGPREPRSGRGRYNLRPPKAEPSQEVTPRTGPVGGHVATKARTRTVVGATLSAYQDRDGTWRRSRSQGHQLRGDLLDVLERAERASHGEAATDRAGWARVVVGEDLPGRAVLPDLLVSTSSMGRSHWMDPWEARVQRWTLVDLDGVEDLDRTGPGLVEALARVVQEDPEASGRLAVVRTSTTGLQVWVELALPRHTPGRWCGLPEVQGWFRRLGGRLLQEVRRLGGRGGEVDPSSLVAGRFGRRPGWRWKSGDAYRSHLLGVVRTPGV